MSNVNKIEYYRDLKSSEQIIMDELQQLRKEIKNLDLVVIISV